MMTLGIQLLAALFAATAATAAATDGKKQLVVGFSQIGAESAWRSAETKSIAVRKNPF